MTTNIEERFFIAYDIPRIKVNEQIIPSTGECIGYDLVYPEITDSILISLICMEPCSVWGLDLPTREELKQNVLKFYINNVDFWGEPGEIRRDKKQIQDLFKVGRIEECVRI